MGAPPSSASRLPQALVRVRSFIAPTQAITDEPGGKGAYPESVHLAVCLRIPDAGKPHLAQRGGAPFMPI